MDLAGISSHFELSCQLQSLKDALETADILPTNNLSDTNISNSSHSNKCIKIGITTGLDVCFTRLLTQYKNDEVGMNRILQLIYQIIKKFSEDSSSSRLNKILTTEFAELLVEQVYSSSWNAVLISDALLCLKLYSEILDDNEIVRRLWERFLVSNGKCDNHSEASMHVLIQFYDVFKRAINDFNVNQDVKQFIYKLLMSDERETRKAALYLIKKVHFHADECLYTFWISYITLLENLEENQSHLILPSLYSYKQNGIKNDPNLQMWIDALYIKILAHQNILVNRWAIEYILESFTCTQISSKVLLQFIIASNNTSLYNHDGFFIPTKNICKFLDGDIMRFMELMAKVHFKCVPLHFWLTHIHMCKGISSDYKYELMLKISAKIRALQNLLIRKKTIEIFENIFHKCISYMRWSEYAVLIETLYNVTDPFTNFETFSLKLLNSMCNNEYVSITSRLYEIISNNLDNTLTYVHPNLKCRHVKECMSEQSSITEKNNLNEIAHYLLNDNISINDNTVWIALVIVFESANVEVVRNICQSCFDLNLDELSGKSFDVLNSNITSKLSHGNDTSIFVRNKFADFFVKEYLTTFTDLSKYIIKAEDILAMGSHKTLLKLSYLLANYKDKVTTSTMDSFLKELKRYSRMSTVCYIVSNNLLEYLKKIWTSCELVNYAKQMLCIDLENVGICAAVLRSGVALDEETYIRGILCGEANFGDARTEELYLLKISENESSHLHHVRSMYIDSVPVDLTKSIIKNLISIHRALSEKKPRYFENSTEHRMKLRILRALILKLQIPEFYGNDLLSTLLYYNNQLNVNYILELLVAKSLPNIETILNKLDEISKYTPSQQVSLISIIHCYCILNICAVSLQLRNIIINKLVPLTMGAHFQTRLYAQLVIYKIFDEYEAINKKDIFKSEDINLQEAISLAVGPQLKELLNDVRLLLPHIYLNDPAEFYDVLMFITSAPSEEYLSNLAYSKYDVPKRLFSKKKLFLTKDTTIREQNDSACSNWNNLQRKMNPESEIHTLSWLERPDKSTGFEMFVVASLVDKVPNLGGIARTCEVLGIRNLILSSRKLVEKEEFKTLSMTAEKNLNVIEVRSSDLQEFFKEKQADGFKIIGAEQTVDSVNIIGFEFPRKCVLVLGHEKAGIPSNILGFLDRTVEIPQFGLIRSLNVHVTGAMFMWEYCKQHIVKNTSSSAS